MPAVAHLGQCPACEHQVRVRVGEREGLVLWRCDGCGLVYQDPQPIGRVAEKYRAGYDLAEHFGALEHRKRVLYERRLARLGPPRPGAERLCDVGCADGQFLEVAREAGWKGCGIELNPPAASRTRERGFEVFEGEFEELDDLPWGGFDLVTCWDALEHTPEPRRFAERLVRLVAPGGHLALTTLNRHSLAWAVFRLNWSMVVEDHFTYWNRRSLERLFAEMGMRKVRHETFGLGRDFVQALDRRRAPTPAETATPEGSTAGWDVGRGVLAAETALNALMRRAGGGVGLDLLLVRPSN